MEKIEKIKERIQWQETLLMAGSFQLYQVDSRINDPMFLSQTKVTFVTSLAEKL